MSTFNYKRTIDPGNRPIDAYSTFVGGASYEYGMTLADAKSALLNLIDCQAKLEIFANGQGDNRHWTYDRLSGSWVEC